MLFEVPHDLTKAKQELVQVVSPTGQLVYVNQTWREILGYETAELSGLSFFSILDPTCRDDFSQLFENKVNPELEQALTLTLRTHAGGKVVVEGTVSLIAREGAIVGAHGTFRDVTAIRREEEARRWSEPSYRTLVENAIDIISTFDPTGKLLSLNPAFERLTGWDRRDWAGKSFIPLLHPDDREFALEWIGRSVKGIRVPLHESRVLTKNGDYVTVESTFKGLYEGGKLQSILAIHRDISERKHTEMLLRESEARFRLMADACFEGIVIHENGMVVEANEMFAKMHGYEVKDVVGKPMLHFTAPLSRSDVDRRVKEHYEENYFKTSIRKDGSVFTSEVRARALPYKGRTVRVAAIREVI